MLGFYDESLAAVTGPLNAFDMNVTTGDVREVLLYVRNDNALTYYTSVSVSTNQTLGLFGTSGMSVKMISSTRRPTEAEWSEVLPGNAVVLPDIGAAGAGDTSTYVPVWFRMYVPAGFSLTELVGQLLFSVSFNEEPV